MLRAHGNSNFEFSNRNDGGSNKNKWVTRNGPPGFWKVGSVGGPNKSGFSFSDSSNKGKVNDAEKANGPNTQGATVGRVEGPFQSAFEPQAEKRANCVSAGTNEKSNKVDNCEILRNGVGDLDCNEVNGNREARVDSPRVSVEDWPNEKGDSDRSHENQDVEVEHWVSDSEQSIMMAKAFIPRVSNFREDDMGFQGNCADDLEEPIVCTPLAVVRPGETYGLELALSGDRREEISVWVQKRAKGFGKFLRVSCAGYEDRIMDLLMEIERGRRSMGKSRSGYSGKSRNKCSRELKQLCCSLNFGQTENKVGQGQSCY